MTQRLNKCEELYKKAMGKYIIVTGKGRGLLTEGEGMKEKLIERGINKDIIFVEKNARNTYENLMFSKEIMERENLHSAIIISDAYHLARIKMICRNIKIHSTVCSEKCNHYSKYEFQALIREIPAYLKDFFFSLVRKFILKN